MNFKEIRTIGFDADDTLWVNEPIFQDTVERLICLLSRHAPPERIRERLYEVGTGNLEHFGYGIKGFVLSMIETALDISGNALTGEETRQIVAMGKEMRKRPLELIDGAEEVLATLRENYRLMLITKGDLLDQESKIARSKLAGYFSHIEILSEKDESAYEGLLTRHRIPREEFLMIGNSVKSDILPVINIGAGAVHIPFRITWSHEDVPLPSGAEPAFLKLGGIEEVPELLSRTG